ncbi:MAG: ferritin-like domain-containing protein [Gammaproteobacteria bacterium]|nr:ferritin-like domain-containing protein [Gammaproteobacteria bacterium]
MTTLPAEYPKDAFEAFGYLKTRQTLSVEDLKVLAMIECYGEVFYQLLASGVKDAEAKALLTRNGQEERGHAHRLLKAIRLKSGEDFVLPSNEDNPFMALAPSEVPANDELLSMLEQGEIDGDLVYQQWADAEPNAEVAQLYRLNGREETRHCERVIEAKKRLFAA